MDQLVLITDMIGTLEIAAHDNKKIKFNSISVEYQEHYLKKLLGEQLYNEFDTGISVGSPLQKWLDLRDGTTFTTQDDKELKWKGLKNFLKYFIFYEYTKDNISAPTVSGETKKQNLYSVYANINQKLQKSYNKGIDLYGLDFRGIAINNIYASDPILYNRLNFGCYGNNNSKSTYSIMNQASSTASAYNFILSKNSNAEDTYPNWEFSKIGFLTW